MLLTLYTPMCTQHSARHNEAAEMLWTGIAGHPSALAVLLLTDSISENNHSLVHVYKQNYSTGFKNSF